MDFIALSNRLPLVPRIHFTHDDDPQFSRPEQLDRSKRHYAKWPVILMVRDPRDTVVSLYHHMVHRRGVFTGSMAEFVRSRRGSLASMVEFMNIWSTAFRSGALRKGLMISYEETHRDADAVLRSVLRVFGEEEPDTEALAFAIDFGRFSNMRRIEASGAVLDRALQVADSQSRNSYKTRKGRVGSWRDEVIAEDAAYVEQYVQHNLDSYYASLGYL